MKLSLQLLVVAFAMVSQPFSAHAQNLFRTGRPDYARPAQPNVTTPSFTQPFANNASDYWNQSWLGRGAASQTAFSPTTRPLNSGSGDYERLVAAWENYRREALRYQGLRGVTDDRPFTANSSSDVAPEYATDWRPTDRRVSDRRPSDRRPIDRRPADWDHVNSQRRIAGRESLNGYDSNHQCEYRRRLENLSSDYPDQRGRALRSLPADNRPRLSPSYRASQYEEPTAGTYTPTYEPRRSSQRPLEPVPMSFSTQRRQSSVNNSPARSQMLDPGRVASRY